MTRLRLLMPSPRLVPAGLTDMQVIDTPPFDQTDPRGSRWQRAVSRFRSISGRAKRRITVAVLAIAIVPAMTGCHNYWLDSGRQFWFLDQHHCGDGSSRIILSSAGSRIGGSTGIFVVTQSSCLPWEIPANKLGVSNTLWKSGSGRCGPFGTLYLNAAETHQIDREHQIGGVCGNGRYFNLTGNSFDHFDLGWQYGETLSPDDYA